MFKAIYCFLSEKPWIGMVSGAGGGLLGSVQQNITNEDALKLGSAVAVWIGVLIAVLTALIKFIELYIKFRGVLRETLDLRYQPRKEISSLPPDGDSGVPDKYLNNPNL